MPRKPASPLQQKMRQIISEIVKIKPSLRERRKIKESEVFYRLFGTNKDRRTIAIPLECSDLLRTLAAELTIREGRTVSQGEAAFRAIYRLSKEIATERNRWPE